MILLARKKLILKILLLSKVKKNFINGKKKLKFFINEKNNYIFMTS